MSREYRDRPYMRKDILLQLYEHGEVNQSKLISYCGLNHTKNRAMIDEMVSGGLISNTSIDLGYKNITMCSISQKGIEVLKNILEPYEQMFPRKN